MTQVLGIFIALAVVLGLLYILRHPEWAIVLVVLQFPLEQLLQSYVPALVATSWIWNVVTGGVAASAVLVSFFRGEQIFTGYFNRVMFFSAGLYLIAVAGLAWTPAPDMALGLMKAHWPYVILKLFIAPLLIRDMESLRRIMIPIMVLGSVIAVLIMLNPSSNYYGGRLRIDLGMYGSTGSNPLELGTLGATCALIATLYRPYKRSTRFNVICVGAFVIGLGLAIGSGSRGQVLAAMIAGVALFPISKELANPKQFFLAAIGLAVLAGGFFVTMKLFIGDQNEARWSLITMIGDIGSRFDMVWTLLGEYLRTPSAWVLGLGPSAYASIDPEISYVHNVYAEALCEEGIFGFACLMLVIVFSYGFARQIFAIHRHDSLYRSTFTVLIAIMLYQMLLSGKQGSLLGFPPMFLWMLLLAKVSITEAKLVADGVIIPAGPDDVLDDESDYEHDDTIEEPNDDPGLDSGHGALA